MNNSKIYLFGNLDGVASAHFIDGAFVIFQDFLENMRSESHLFVRRVGDLVYYGYVRRLYPEERAVGICFVLNGVLLPEYDKLIKIFEQAIGWLVDHTSIIGLDEQGRLVPLIDDWNEAQQDVHAFIDEYQDSLSRLRAEQLPPIPYGEQQGGKIGFPLDVSESKFLNATSTQNLVIISKDGDCDLPGLLRQRTMLHEQYQQITQLQTESNELKSDVQRLKREKKQFKWVISLLLLLIIGGFFFYTVYQSMGQELSRRNDVIVDREEQILENNRTISYQDDRIKAYEQLVDKLLTENKDWETRYTACDSLRIFYTEKYNELEEIQTEREAELERMEEAANYWKKQYQMK